MTLKKRLLSLLLALTCVWGVLILPATAAGSVSTAAAGTNNSATYSRRVVSVLFDNSGSMAPNYYPYDKRNGYAKYALQTLAALLGKDDTLLVTPLNVPGSSSEIKNGNYTYELDLTASNRNTQVDNLLTSSFLAYTPQGGTPLETPLRVAADQLVDRGMVTQDAAGFETDNTEYWLFVLTDGAFNEGNADTERILAEYTKKYNSFHMVYLALGTDAIDLTSPANPDLRAAGNFKAYISADVAGIVDTMQQIANQISGRYTAPASLYTVSGNQVTIDLSQLEFAVHNISLMMQGTNAVLQNAVYQSASLLIEQPCIIRPNSELSGVSIGNAYTALLKPSAQDYMSGGQVVLTFSAPVSDVILMIEPMLSLRPVVERMENGVWVPTDRLYINSDMKPGDAVRVNYEVYEEGSGRVIDITKLFGKAQERVTYAGKTYAPGDTITLVEGSNDIVLSVSVMNGTYTLYHAYGCVVSSTPGFYRIEGNAHSTDGDKGEKYDLEFVVFVDNKPMSQAELATYVFSLTGTDPEGNALPLNYTMQSDGKVVCSVNLAPLPYGEVVFDAKIVAQDGFYRTAQVKLYNVPRSVDVQLLGNAQMTKTQNRFQNNTDKFTYTVRTEKNGLIVTLDPVLYEYKLTFDGVDVTDKAVLNGEQIEFTPNADTLGELLQRVGDHTLTLSANPRGQAGAVASVSATVTVTPTVYEVISSVSGGGTVNPFHIKENDVEVFFSVKRDGDYLTIEELKQAFEQGELTVSVDGRNFIEKGLGSFKSENSFEEINGVPTLKTTFTTRHISVLACFSGMLVFPGSRAVSVSCAGVDATQPFAIEFPGIFAYIWRLLVIFLIVHIVMLIVFYRNIARFQPGQFITLTVKLDERMKIKGRPSKKVTAVSRAWYNHIFWRRIFVPVVYWVKGAQNVSLEGGKVTLIAQQGASAPLAEIQNKGKFKDAYFAKMRTSESVDCRWLEMHIASGKFNVKEIAGRSLPHDNNNRLFKERDAKDAKAQETKQSRAVNLSRLSIQPICSKNGDYYTFYFFIPDKK